MVQWFSRWLSTQEACGSNPAASSLLLSSVKLAFSIDYQMVVSLINSKNRFVAKEVSACLL